MKKLFPVILFGLLLFTSCISLETKIDDRLFNQYLTKSYNSSKSKCIEATIAALKIMKTGIEKVDQTSGIIITEKTPFHSERVVSSDSWGRPVGKDFVFSHKYYFKITGNDKQATVQVYKYRLWKNAIEKDELDDLWTNNHVWKPLFKEIQFQLEEM